LRQLEKIEKKIEEIREILHEDVIGIDLIEETLNSLEHRVLKAMRGELWNLYKKGVVMIKGERS